jgi:hypothetical protein
LLDLAAAASVFLLLSVVSVLAVAAIAGLAEGVVTALVAAPVAITALIFPGIGQGNSRESSGGAAESSHQAEGFHSATPLPARDQRDEPPQIALSAFEAKRRLNSSLEVVRQRLRIHQLG